MVSYYTNPVFVKSVSVSINYFLVWLLANKKEILHTLDCHVCWFCRVVMGKWFMCQT